MKHYSNEELLHEEIKRLLNILIGKILVFELIKQHWNEWISFENY
jgi:hypothetical protein